MKFTKKSIYIGLFSVLYLIVAFSSFFHACAFFGLANNSWMSVILAFAFEVGQAAVLFSLLTSQKDRSRIMPWVLMGMFTLVQVIGNVYSSYKYIITNSVENLRYFKEPIFIWTELPDAQANVIIVYLVGALLPIAALLLTSMITNYLTDEEEKKQALEESKIEEQKIEGTDPDGGIIGEQGEDGLKVLTESLNSKDNEIEQLKKELEELKQLQIENTDVKNKENCGGNGGSKDQELQQMETDEQSANEKSSDDIEYIKEYESTDEQQSDETKQESEDNQDEQETELVEENNEEDIEKRQSHFINL